jgi:hypothetical protein
LHIRVFIKQWLDRLIVRFAFNILLPMVGSTDRSGDSPRVAPAT